MHKTFRKLLLGCGIILPLRLLGQVPDPPIKGEINHYVFDQSKIFPGTTREYWIYIPREYDPAKPACLLVDQDRIQFKAPAVLDHLIGAGQMPVTIAVFVQPGRVTALSPTALDRFNRSYEYDGLGDAYVRFLIEELLPEAERQHTLDGRPIRLSHRATDRAIMGSSSGAIAAFTAAWERPDQFSRVFSAIGTYVNQRGGNIYPSLIRKYEPKPMRIFLQDGSADHNLVGGNWFLANQEMESALTYAGYEVNHIWGTGDHDDKQATAIFADALRWLWKDWPIPPAIGHGSEQLQKILSPGEHWTPAPQKSRSVPKNSVTTFHVFTFRADTQGIWQLQAGSKPKLLDPNMSDCQGIALSPDQSLLYAGNYHSHWVYSYQIQSDGTLAYKQKFYDLYVRANDDDAGIGGLCVDREGRLYIATRAGVQVCDQAGRLIAILPIDNAEISDVYLGGENLQTLFVQAADKPFARSIKVQGIRPGEAPFKPHPPRL